MTINLVQRLSDRRLQAEQRRFSSVQIGTLPAVQRRLSHGEQNVLSTETDVQDLSTMQTVDVSWL